MSLSPYRTLAEHEPERAPPAPHGAYDVAFAALLALVLGAVRVAFALWRHEAPCREIDLAWILAMLGPFVLWKELAANRGAKRAQDRAGPRR